MNPVLILGLSPTGLHAVRELSTLNITIYGVSRGKQAASCSKYVKEVSDILPSNFNAILKYIEYIYKIEGEKIVLLPTSDDYIEFIVRCSSYLMSYCILPTSYKTGDSDLLSDKSRFYNLCESLDVKHAIFNICKCSDFIKTTSQMTLPILVKPIQSHSLTDVFSGKKVLIIETSDQVTSLSKRMENLNDKIILQEIIPGPDSNITLYASYIDAKGNFHEEFTGRKIRQYPPGFGSASLARSCSDLYTEKTKLISRKILSHINYHGIAATEFKIDCRDNSLKVIEINARPGLWFELSSASGINIVKSYYLSLTNSNHQSRRTIQIDDIFWKYTFKDILSYFYYLIWGNKFIIERPMVDTYIKKKIVFPVFSISDIKPFFCEIYRNFRSLLSIK